MRGLSGKRVLITGGASGIGAATAKRFLEEGSAVVVLDRDAQARDHIRHELPGLAGTVDADVSNLKQVHTAFDDAIRLMGGVDVGQGDRGESDRRVLHGPNRRKTHVGARQRRDSADRVDKWDHGISVLR